MVKNTHSFFFYSLALCLTLSCRPQITLVPDYEGDKLTINGIISPDSALVRLSKSLSPYENHVYEDFFVKNGQVWISDENGKRITNLNSNDGFNFYSYEKKLEIGKKYIVFATASDLPQAESHPILIPKRANIYFEHQKIDSITHKLSVTLQDALGEQNYYDSGFSFLQDKKVKHLPVASLNQCSVKATFDDVCFEGKKTILNYEFSSLYFTNALVDTIYFHFGAISQEAFLWNESKPIPNQNINPALGQSLDDSALSYTNVKNGYGVVYAQNWEQFLFF